MLVPMTPATPDIPSKRVLLLGATGTIGRATADALSVRGYRTVCFGRKSPPANIKTEFRRGDVTDLASLLADGIRGESFDAVVSCLASRTGVVRDAWAIDYAANVNAIAAAQQAGVPQMVLLSAICVQRPKLAFQNAKLAAENALIESGLTYSIVRPTAFFKSLSGQIARVRQGKPFLLFGDGALTSCKPISDGDLARFIIRCLEDETLRNRILPIGGPGDAITPRQQGERLFALLGQPPKFRHVPVSLLDVIAGTLDLLGKFNGKLAEKAELARIGRYYATESMLCIDPETDRYDADKTPSTGSETLFDHYARVIRGEVTVERGEHAVF